MKNFSLKFLLIILSYFLLTTVNFAQFGELWTKEYNIGQNLNNLSLIETSDKGFIILCTNDSTVAILIKTDSLGNKLWQKEYKGNGDCGKNIVETNDGFIFYGTKDNEGWLVKTDLFGDTLWTKKYVNRGQKIIKTRANDILILGDSTQTYDPYHKVWLAKINNTGNLLNTTSFNISSAGLTEYSMIDYYEGNSVVIMCRPISNDSSNDSTQIIVTGFNGLISSNKNYLELDSRVLAPFSSPTESDSGYVIFGNGSEWDPSIIVSKINLYGELEWSKKNEFSNSSFSSLMINSAKRTSEGQYILAGFVKKTNNIKLPTIFLVNNEGEIITYRSFPKDTTDTYRTGGEDIINLDNGNIFWIGKYSNNVFFSKIVTAPTAKIMGDTLLVDTDWDGTVEATYDGSSSFHSMGYTITNYEWKLNGKIIGTESTLTVNIPTGFNTLELKVTDENNVTNTFQLPAQVCSYKLATQGAITSSISTIGDSLFFASSTDDQIYSFNNQNKFKWNLQTGGDIQSTTTIGPRGNIYVGSNDTRIYSFNVSGNFNWDKPMGGIVTASPAISQEGTIYVGTATNRLYALNSSNGDVKWNFLVSDSITSSASIGKDGKVYFGSVDKNFYSVNPGGTENWKYTTNGAIHSSPAIDSEGNIYFGSDDNKFYSLSSTGTLNWTFTTNGKVHSSPVIDEAGNIYFGSADGYFYSVNKSGEELWKYNTESSILSNPSISKNGDIVFGCENGKLISLTKTGELNWYFKANGALRAAPLVTKEGRIYIGSLDKTIYGFIDNRALGKVSSEVVYQWPTFQHDNQRSGSVLGIETAVKEVKNNLPTDFALHQNYPNPFNPTTKIEFLVPEAAKLQLTIYDITGAVVRGVTSDIQGSGNYSFNWNGLNDQGTQVSSGVYIFRMNAIGKTKNYSHSIKMIKLK